MSAKTKAPVVTFLNARTCGIYKNGGVRYKTDPGTGKRTGEIDDELERLVDLYLSRKGDPGIVSVPLAVTESTQVLVPTYFDARHDENFDRLVEELGWKSITIGEMIDGGWIRSRGGHGSPGNDQRSGTIPYIKVSDIRALRVNTNPTNLVGDSVAKLKWHGDRSGIEPFDVVTPNRASSNIGEFAIFLPGEEQVVITKEVFIFRVLPKAGTVWDPFSLFWALCLRPVRMQWKRIALMQTNREDCGERYREIRLPLPPTAKAAKSASAAFRDYFSALAAAKSKFIAEVGRFPERYIASVFSAGITAEVEEEEAAE